MRKNLFLLLMCMTTSVTVLMAQDTNDAPPEEKKGFDKSRLFFGGNFGLSFGDYTFINVSPQLGYRFSRYFAAGAGINGQYSQFKYRANDEVFQRQKYGVVGFNIFGRVYPIPQIVIQAQPEINYVWREVSNYNPDEKYKDNQFVPSLLLGGGVAIPAGRAGSFVIMAQYDVLQNDLSPYGRNPFLTFGVNFGF